MSIRRQLNNTIDFLDKQLMLLTHEKPHLLVLFFHKIYKTKSEAFNGLSLPMEATTAEDLAAAIETLLENNYTFIKPKQVFSQEKLPKNLH